MDNSQPDDPEQDEVKAQAVEPKMPELDERHTVVLHSKQVLRRASQAKAAKGTISFGQHELILVIRGMVERLTIQEDATVLLGRADHQSRYNPEVDLTPYGALDRGVSREHARLHIEDGRLYVTDLGSTNGTFVGGVQLEPDTPRLIGQGDELLLGRLSVQVMFR